MNEWERLHQQAKRYQAEYPPGTRIMLLNMGKDPCPVEDQTSEHCTARLTMDALSALCLGRIRFAS